MRTGLLPVRGAIFRGQSDLSRDQVADLDFLRCNDTITGKVSLDPSQPDQTRDNVCPCGYPSRQQLTTEYSLLIEGQHGYCIWLAAA